MTAAQPSESSDENWTCSVLLEAFSGSPCFLSEEAVPAGKEYHEGIYCCAISMLLNSSVCDFKTGHGYMYHKYVFLVHIGSLMSLELEFRGHIRQCKYLLQVF